jgi:plastocyanin
VATTAVAAPPSPSEQAGAATLAPAATPLPRPSAVSLTFRAANLAFDQSIVRVPAGATVTATLQNDDEGVEHNLSFSLAGLAHGETCKGPCTRTQSFTAAEPGSYYFLCTLHDMVGTFIVEP